MKLKWLKGLRRPLVLMRYRKAMDKRYESAKSNSRSHSRKAWNSGDSGESNELIRIDNKNH